MFESFKRENEPAASYFEHLQALAEVRHDEADGDVATLAKDAVYCGLVASLATCEAMQELAEAGMASNEETSDSLQDASSEVAEALAALTEALQVLASPMRSPRAPRARA